MPDAASDLSLWYILNVPMLTVIWAANFALAAGAAATGRLVSLIGAEIALLIGLGAALGWPYDSNIVQVLFNVATSLVAAAWVAGVLRAKVGPNVPFGARHVLKIGYPLIGLAFATNLCFAIVRQMVYGVLS